MGDYLRIDKPSQYITNTNVNSAFHRRSTADQPQIDLKLTTDQLISQKKLLLLVTLNQPMTPQITAHH